MTTSARLALVSIALLGWLLPSAVYAGDEKALIGSYRLVKRVAADGTEKRPPEVVGFMTFTKDHRTVIMKWEQPGADAGSIAEITAYSLSGGKFCEREEYGVNGNLGALGVTYDIPSDKPSCSSAIADASGLAFDIPGEKLRLRIVRDGIIATTPKWTDHWEKVK